MYLEKINKSSQFFNVIKGIFIRILSKRFSPLEMQNELDNFLLKNGFAFFVGVAVFSERRGNAPFSVLFISDLVCLTEFAL